MAKSVRVMELEEAIAQAGATLDEAEATRIGLQEGIDSVREILSDAYGVGFEKAVSENLSVDDDDDDEIDDEDEDE